MPPLGDWNGTFLPATLALFAERGGNPYAYIYNPPWVLFPLVPFAVLPYPVGLAMMLGCSILASLAVARKCGAKPIAAGLFVLSVFTLNGIAIGNVEWLALLGLVAAPPVSFLLLLVKPQMTFCVVLFLLVEMWRRNERRKLAVSLATIGGAFGLSVLAYGFWFSHISQYLGFAQTALNASLYPYALPVGVGLFVTSLVTRRMEFALAASPCFFPVITLQAWSVVLLAMVTIPSATLVAFCGSWAAAIVKVTQA